MKPLFLRSVATSCAVILACVAPASSRPHYGGAAHIVLHDHVTNLDPTVEEDHPAARDQLARLLFEPLATVDEQGRLLPGLASAWTSDPNKRIWEFHLRLAGFHDGSPVTAADVATSLIRAGIPWKCIPFDWQTIRIEAPSAAPHVPEMLAMEKFAIIKRQPDGTMLGTGPYKLSEWQPGERALLAANEEHWGGRAYPDVIEVQMGVSLRELLLERRLGPYAAAELTLDQLRALDLPNQNVAVSAPSDLFAILFLQRDGASRAGKKAVDPRIREALANCLDRGTTSNVLLQRKSTPATGLLPQWLTGYEVLLPNLSDRANARKLAAEAAGRAPRSSLSLAYDLSDPVAKLVAERIGVDAGQVGLTVRTNGEAHVNTKTSQAVMAEDAVLLRLPLRSLEPTVALAALAGDLGLDTASPAALAALRPEDLFEIERKMLENFRVVPVAHVSQAVWLNESTHNWLQLPNGAWDLTQLWVEGARSSVP